MDTNKQRGRAPPESAKQKRKRTTEVESTQEVADKRRKQNRLSQREHRKKQHAYMRTMESFIDAVKVSNEAEGEHSRYSRLLKAHTELIEENRRLREIFISVRRRLLNLADQVTCDPESDANPAVEPDDASRSSETTPLAPLPVALDTTSDLYAAPNEPREKSNYFDEPLEAQTAIVATSQDHFEELIDINFDLEPILPIVEPEYAVPAHNALPVVSQASPEAPHRTFEIQTHGANAQPLSHSTPLYQQPYPFPTPAECPRTLSNATIFAQQATNAARRFAVHPNRWLVAGLTTPTEKRMLITKVASTAVQVIGAHAGLGTYIYPTRFAVYLEYIMRWRILQSREDLLAIPEPFRPTPLQCSDINYPVVIDFINWPSIRDQMLLHLQYLDLDAMCRDIVLNTVVELPEFGIAVNVHDLLFNYILPRTEGVQRLSGKQSMLHNPSWVYLQVDSSKATAADDIKVNSTDDMLFREIATLIASQSSTDSNSVVPLGESAGPSFQGLSQINEWSLTTALSSFRVYDVLQWRLSKDFARKYPYIDCASAVSKFEMIACDSEQFKCKIVG